MPKRTRDQIKQWFETGDYPTQDQFYDLFDSILFQGEVQITDVEGLVKILQGKSYLDGFEKVVFAGNGSHVIEVNHLLEKVIILPSATAAIKIGTAAGADDINPEMEINSANGEVIFLNLFAPAQRTIYFSGLPAGTTILFFKRFIKLV